MATRDELAGMTEVDEVWQVLRRARTDGDEATAELARRRLAELTPANDRAVRPSQADPPMPLGRRLALALGVGLAVAVAIGVGLALVGFGNIAWPGAAVGLVVGAALGTIAGEPNRVHHPDAGAESIMNYVRGEGP